VNIIPIIAAVLVGGAGGAYVSSLISLWDKHLDRKVRRREIIFNKAFELAKDLTELTMKVAKEAGQTAVIAPTLYRAEKFYEEAESLFDTGKLTDAYREIVEARLNKT
jgi:hypothetical protein